MFSTILTEAILYLRETHTTSVATHAPGSIPSDRPEGRGGVEKGAGEFIFVVGTV